ncbi:PREDICTED: uncharacterized protein LOC106815564, partial [Priapulus caudatus]|uniref:Uncharacterized protein LOC106815564 n=1 Tax=Priapulus caudatus TaxID=37621 RepID=A0ABM1ETJ9_PRICU
MISMRGAVSVWLLAVAIGTMATGAEQDERDSRMSAMEEKLDAIWEKLDGMTSPPACSCDCSQQSAQTEHLAGKVETLVGMLSDVNDTLAARMSALDRTLDSGQQTLHDVTAELEASLSEINASTAALLSAGGAASGEQTNEMRKLLADSHTFTGYKLLGETISSIDSLLLTF